MARRRVALRVAYDGSRFHGSQRQPRVRTVEGDLLHALAAVGAGEDAKSLEFRSASRTDRGVSAAGNVFAVTTAFRLGELQGALNAHLEDAWVTAVAEAPEGFNPRHARERRYRYLLPAGAADAGALARALRQFEGVHDFTSFARVEPGVNPTREVTRVVVAPAGAHLRLEFTAPSFLWNQVRRMVAAGVAVARGEAPREAVAAALARERDVDLGVAPPEPLVLLHVAHDDVDLPPGGAPGLTRALEAARLRAAVLSTLAEGGAP